ncbi:MAG: alpha/beta hydrolase [Betaproteobacteria bacterium]
MNRFRHLVSALFAGLVALGHAGLAGATEPPPDCHVGAYAMADGSSLDIGPGEQGQLRWRRPEGTSGAFAIAGPQAGASTLGWTPRADGHHVELSDCASGAIAMDSVAGRRVALPTLATRFASDGVDLVGRLVMPPGDAPVPVVVLLHGSEHDAALPTNSLQRRLPAQGIGIFVYDKRGTGESGGKYTQDFEQLARDAAVALHEARRLGGARVARIGYQGPSQGGWVAPLAAKRAGADFVIVGFGLAVSVIEEDRSAVALNIRDKGWPPEVMAKAMALVDAVDALAMTPTPEVFDRFAAVRDPLRDEPWFRDVRGDFAWALLNLKKAELAPLAKLFDFGTPWLYDPMATLASVKSPQLWILGSDDLDAPSAETARRLAFLRTAGRPIATAMFAHAEHGILEYELGADGQRLSTRHPEGYLQLMVDFARGAPLKARYGNATLAR